MDRTLIIEPHGDDAFISAFSILGQSNETPTDIITFACRPSTYLENIYDLLETTYVGFEDIDYHLRTPCNTHEFNRIYKSGEDVHQYAESLLYDKLGLQIADSSKQVCQYLSTSVFLQPIRYSNILVPLGIDHPYHVAVRKGFDMVDPLLYEGSRVIYYIEKPYSAKRYVSQVVEHYIREMESFSGISYIRKTVPMTSDSTDIKKSIFLKAYPTEGSLLVYTSDVIYKFPDEYVEELSL